MLQSLFLRAVTCRKYSISMGHGIRSSHRQIVKSILDALGTDPFVMEQRTSLRAVQYSVFVNYRDRKTMMPYFHWRLYGPSPSETAATRRHILWLWLLQPAGKGSCELRTITASLKKKKSLSLFTRHLKNKDQEHPHQLISTAF